jgi:glycosyltransferase involved in cell wall biosynthesis
MSIRITPGSDAPDVSIVVPLKDEAPTLRQLYASITDALKDLSWELLLVDDGSIDSSYRVAASLAQSDPRVHAIRLRRNFGKAAALSTGFREARGSVIVTMDADMQDDPAEIPKLLAVLDAGYDVVSGWKSKRKDPWTRRMASRVFNRVTSFVSKVHLHDVNCGLKAYTGEAARDLAAACYGELHRFLPVLAHWRGYRVTEVPVNHRRRAYGRSRYGLERYLRGFLDLLTAGYLARYVRRPMHVFGGVGLLLFVPGLMSLTYLIVSKLFFGDAIGNRPMLVLGAVLCITGLQLILTGLLAEVISGPRASDVPYSRLSSLPQHAEQREAHVFSLEGSQDDEESSEMAFRREPS